MGKAFKAAFMRLRPPCVCFSFFVVLHLVFVSYYLPATLAASSSLHELESVTSEDGVHFVRTASGSFRPVSSSQRQLRAAIDLGEYGAAISDSEFLALLERPDDAFDPALLSFAAAASESDNADEGLPDASSPSSDESFADAPSSSLLSRSLKGVFDSFKSTPALEIRRREAFAAERANFSALPRIPSTHCNGVLKPSFDCLGFYRQKAVVRIPPPRGSLLCPGNCSGLGVCDHDVGKCRCPAGYGGDACELPRKRPCFKMGSDKRDTETTVDPTWSHSRCNGVCDDDLAMCYCPPETKQGRIEAPANSPRGTPPIKGGRPMFWCHLKEDKDGTPVKYGAMSYNALFGEDGWCNAEQPPEKNRCPCRLDGFDGLFCEVVTEQTCPNQCSGRGECNLGFCKCHDGYYGHDCASRRKGHRLALDDSVFKKRYLQPVMTPPPAGEDPPLTAFRARPLIYVYDLPPRFGSDMLQYRIESGSCVYRRFFTAENTTRFIYHNYMLEMAFHEMLLTSTHRTMDPEEADFFFVPAYAACLFSLISNNEIPAFPPGALGTRSFGSSMLQLEAKRWIQQNFPFWDRLGGRDHIWLNLHDEGACYVHNELWPSIHLTHWGRKDMPHRSNTNYFADNYTVDQDFGHVGWPSGKWLNESSRAHPCYDPKKDLVIPAFFPTSKHGNSPFLGDVGITPASEVVPGKVLHTKRDLLMVFRGDVGLVRHDPHCTYSRCIRQRLLNISIAQNWTAHNAHYGPASKPLGDYSPMLARSNFSLVLPGDGWSYRLEDSILHGCIPVIIMDDVDVVFETLFDFKEFSIRVSQKDLDKVLDIVKAVPPETVSYMQANIAEVWHRFRYNRPKAALAETREVVKRYDVKARGLQIKGHKMAETPLDDAFDTIMQWLYGRIPKIHKTKKTNLKISSKKWFQVANLYLP